jgi:hypothetical protein
LSEVRLPEIKRKKEAVEIFDPRAKDKPVEPKHYYSYKSPNFKEDSDIKNAVSMQADPVVHFRNASNEKKVNSFEHEPAEQKRAVRAQTAKPNEPSKEALKNDKSRPEKKSAEKPEYRIKKSTSV